MFKFRGHTVYPGYYYKFCPYSVAFREKYTDQGYIGNSNNGNVPFPSANITEHTTTSGTMNMKHRPGLGWGWMCFDTACYHYTTYGRYYFES